MNWSEALNAVAAEALAKAPDLTDDDLAVLTYIFECDGVGNACTSRAVAEGLGWEGRSADIKVRHCVERLVRAGLPVCSSRRRPHFGYYVPADEEEMLEALAPLQSEAAERFARVNALDGARVKIRLELDGYSAKLAIPRRLKPESTAQLTMV